MLSVFGIAERLLNDIITEYAGREGDRDKMNKEELKELLQNQMADFLKTQTDPDVVDKIFRDTDQNCDGQIDYDEYVTLVCRVLRAKGYHRKPELASGP